MAWSQGIGKHRVDHLMILGPAQERVNSLWPFDTIWCHQSVSSVIQEMTTYSVPCLKKSLIARFMGPTCGPSGADRTQVPHVGPINFAIWDDAELLTSRLQAKIFLEVIIKNQKMHLKMLSVKCWPFCLGLDELTALVLKPQCYRITSLTHWGRVTHICVSKLTIIGSDNGLAPWRRQAIIWTNAGILLIGPLGTNSVKF